MPALETPPALAGLPPGTNLSESGEDDLLMNPVPPDFLRPLLARPVAILGGGASVFAVRELLVQVGARCEIYDENPGVGAAGRFTRAEATGHGLVVFSPGFPVGHNWLQAARAAGSASDPLGDDRHDAIVRRQVTEYEARIAVGVRLQDDGRRLNERHRPRPSGCRRRRGAVP